MYSMCVCVRVCEYVSMCVHALARSMHVFITVHVAVSGGWVNKYSMWKGAELAGNYHIPKYQPPHPYTQKPLESFLEI